LNFGPDTKAKTLKIRVKIKFKKWHDGCRLEVFKYDEYDDDIFNK
jgi:hypothetical protein